jgi:predicted transcriptional regulator
MEDTLNISLTPELRAAIDRLTEAEGLSPEGLVQRALQEFVFVHQFRSLREQLLQKAQADYTDDDIFEMMA